MSCLEIADENVTDRDLKFEKNSMHLTDSKLPMESKLKVCLIALSAKKLPDIQKLYDGSTPRIEL